MQGLALAKFNKPITRRTATGTAKKVYIQDDWDELCAISREYLDEAKAADILALSLNPYFMKDYKPNDTMQTVVDKATEEICAKYAPSLQKEFGKDNTHFWILVRVGVKRIIAHKVTCA